MNHKKGLMALSPLLVFVLLYLVTSVIAGDFYKVPVTVAFLLSSIFAVAVSGGLPLRQRIDTFSKGAGSGNMMLMLWIFIMAGAFAGSAKAMGSIDAAVHLTMNVLPANMLLAGLFLAACFVSMSIGTSVGTIVALAPIAAGIAGASGANVPFLVAVVVGGAFFGDNLSFISDTTIAATSTQGCKMRDKFKVNSLIVIPAAAVTFIVYVVMGRGIHTPSALPGVEYVKVLPYLVVLVASCCGMNVMAVLAVGLALTGMVGIAAGAFDAYGWFSAMGGGITGMGELIIITVLAGGMLELIKANGGISYLIAILTRRVKGKRGAELSIALLVSLINCCTANNTVAIITVGDIARQISGRYGVDKRKCASILDTMSCCTQGLIPYGAQLLMAAGLAGINPVSIVPYLYYPMLIGLCTVGAILLRYPSKYS